MVKGYEFWRLTNQWSVIRHTQKCNGFIKGEMRKKKIYSENRWKLNVWSTL